MTCVTVSSSVFAEAPGYVAVTEMLGGAILGYCATGRLLIDNTPSTIRMMATTQAKTGRSMQNLLMRRSFSMCRCRRLAQGGRGGLSVVRVRPCHVIRGQFGRNRLDRRAGPQSLKIVDDHLIARLEPFGN